MNSSFPADPNNSEGRAAWGTPPASPPPFEGFGVEATSIPPFGGGQDRPQGVADGSAFGGAPQTPSSPPPFGNGAMGEAPRQEPPQVDMMPPPMGDLPAASERWEAPPAQSPTFSDEIVAVSCPACGHGLKLRREHVGIEGQCINCGLDIVAVEYPGQGIRVERLLKNISPSPPVVQGKQSPALEAITVPPVESWSNKSASPPPVSEPSPDPVAPPLSDWSAPQTTPNPPSRQPAGFGWDGGASVPPASAAPATPAPAPSAPAFQTPPQTQPAQEQPFAPPSQSAGFSAQPGFASHPQMPQGQVPPPQAQTPQVSNFGAPPQQNPIPSQQDSWSAPVQEKAPENPSFPAPAAAPEPSPATPKSAWGNAVAGGPPPSSASSPPNGFSGDPLFPESPEPAPQAPSQSARVAPESVRPPTGGGGNPTPDTDWNSVNATDVASQLASKEDNFGNLFGQSAPSAAPVDSARPAEKPAADLAAPNQAANDFAGFGQKPPSEKSEGTAFPPPASQPEAEKSSASSPVGARSDSPFGEGPGLGNLPNSIEPGDPMPSITEGFSSLFAKNGEPKDGSSEKMAWMNSEPTQSSDAASNQEVGEPPSASPFGRQNETSPPTDKEPAWSNPPGDQEPENGPVGFGRSAFSDTAPDEEKPVFAPRDSSQDKGSKKKKKAKSKGVFSPLVIAVMLLGAIFLGGIYLLRTYGGVEGVKSRVMSRLQTMISSVGQATAVIVEPESQQNIPGSTTADATPAQPPPATALVPTTEGTPSATPSADESSELATDPDPFIPQETEKEEPLTTPPPSGTAATDTPPAPADVPKTPTIGSTEVKEPATPTLAQPVSPVATVPAPQVAATGSAESGAQAAALPSTEAPKESAPAEEEAQEDPGMKMAAILEPVGEEVIKGFYSTSSIDGRAAYVLDQEANQPRMEAYYRRYQNPPTLRSVSFRGPMRDAASGRWFGVFDVRENENEEVHRWCVVQVRPGEMKLDWVIYQQLIDGSLDRFLADPAAPAKGFNLVIRRGEEAPSDENPWSGTTWEIYVQPPLDTAQPRVLLVRDSDFQRLGLDSALIGGNARIGRVELGWTPSEIEPLTRVPTVTKVLGWGAW